MSRNREEDKKNLAHFYINDSTYDKVSDKDLHILSSSRGVDLMSAITHPDAAALNNGYKGYYNDDAFDCASFTLEKKGEQFFYWFCDYHAANVRIKGWDMAYILAEKLYTPNEAARYEPDSRGFAGDHNDNSAQAGHSWD